MRALGIAHDSRPGKPELDQPAPRSPAASYLSGPLEAANGSSLHPKAATAFRAKLCDEAIALGRLLVTLLRVQRLYAELPESLGLLALMLLHDSRRETRADADGRIVPLLEQDRARWDAGKIREGRRALAEAGRVAAPDPYQLQAAISAQHAEAPSPADTDWHAIARHYRRLEELQPNPVVRLNRLIAESYAHGPEEVLPDLEALTASGGLGGYAPLHAALGDAYERAGRTEEAREAFLTAAGQTTNRAEAAHLSARAEALSR